MRTDSEIKMHGYEVLNRYLGMVEAEKFISLVLREKFDYTKWRENLFKGLSGKEISSRAMDFQKEIENLKEK
ncbi:MAG: hypothetical protein HQM10_15710 [Candidatus Riflebacteria bacterium]|nr:hypothetical protein [Candidatus Riflebacteria bacterium]